MTSSAQTIKITLPDGSVIRRAIQTPVRDCIAKETDVSGLPVLGAVVNNDVVSLSYPVEVDSTLRPLTRADSHGWHVYRDSVCFLLAKTATGLFPQSRLVIEHSLGNGLYCTFERQDRTRMLPEETARLREAMCETVNLKLPIERRMIPFSDALDHCMQRGAHDKANLLRFRNPPKIAVHWCDGYMDIARGPLAGHTGMLGTFDLIPYEAGFVLRLPAPDQPGPPASFDPQPHLFAIFKEYKQWGRIVGVRTAGDVNELIATGAFEEFVRINEALHEKRIAQIADRISAEAGRIRWVFIAGPSSSGKTTFAKRLSVQLRVNGLRPVTLSVDDYFVPREQTPRGNDGQYDFEHIETIDLALLHDHFKRLDGGEEVEAPVFDFPSGTRRQTGRRMRLKEDQVAIIEGIHSLNPRLTGALPPDHQFKIYISALTQLNLDFHNRISTTDNRLLRRMVRDHQFRGNKALDTLRMWPAVRRGEKEWIFPYQQSADVAFSSALDYELPVLRVFAEPLLLEVKPCHVEYAVARRLQSFLACFLHAAPDAVPATSLLREFIGQSGFRYTPAG